MDLRIAFFAIVISVMAVILCQIDANQSQSYKNKFMVDLGPAKLSVSYGQKEITKAFRLAERYIKTKLLSKLTTSDEPVGRFEVRQLEDLIRCDNISIARADLKDHIDCIPMHTYGAIHDPENGISTPTTDFTVETKFFSKLSFDFISANKLVEELTIYQLSKKYTDRNLARLINYYEIDYPSDDLKETLNFGYYIVFTLMDYKCYGELALAVNVTEKATRGASLEQMTEFLLAQAKNNGYLFAIDHLYCNTKVVDLRQGLMINFLIAERREFPYIALNYSMMMIPHEDQFSIHASVRQSKNETNQSYNTTIAARSKSHLLDVMNFIYHQNFQRENERTGLENIVLATTDYIFSIESVWKFPVFFFNILNIYPTVEEGNLTSVFKTLFTFDDGNISALTTISKEFLSVFKDSIIEFKDIWASFKEKLISSLFSRAMEQAKKITQDVYTEKFSRLEL